MTSFSWIRRFQHPKILGKLYSCHVLCPNVAIFLKNVFIFKDRTLKKNSIERTRISMWVGRENDENVVRTRDWCGWPSSPLSIPPVRRYFKKHNKCRPHFGNTRLFCVCYTKFFLLKRRYSRCFVIHPLCNYLYLRHLIFF